MSVSAALPKTNDAAAQRSPTVIVGLGATGLSCARFLARQGLPFVVMDSRASPPKAEAFRREFPDLPPLLGGFDAGDVCRADCLERFYFCAR
jgi:UDP-N-acetylmuramoylalanine--D-glutamate ligase